MPHSGLVPLFRFFTSNLLLTDPRHCSHNHSNSPESMFVSTQQPVVLVVVIWLLSVVSGDDGEQEVNCISFFTFIASFTFVSDELLQINKLRKRLLKDQSYQRSSRPVLHHSTITNVSLTVFIRKIVGLDLKTSSLTTHGTLHMV